MATPKTGRPRGRPPKPTALKQADGNPGKRKMPRPLEVTMPEEVEGVPSPPPLYEDGLKMWNLIWTAGKQWLNIYADYYAVKNACQFYEEAEFLRLQRDAGAFDRTVVLSNGTEITHPKIHQMYKAMAMHEGAMAQIGFTPAARAKLEIAISQSDDPMMDMAGRMKENREKHMKIYEEAKAEKEARTESEREPGDIH